MARIFITGSSTGLGLMAGQLLIEQGHQVVLHGRNRTRAEQAMAVAPGAQAAVVGDLSQISDTRSVAEQVNQLGRFDAVIHNAGVGYREGRPVETEQSIPDAGVPPRLASRRRANGPTWAVYPLNLTRNNPVLA